VRIVVIGAGQVGSTVVEALHEGHQLTVLDVDPERLAIVGDRFDVATVEGNGASRRALEEARVRDSELLIACTSRDEINIIAAVFTRKLSPSTPTIVRTTDEEYLEVWQERYLDVDLVVSSERETALAVSQTIGIPAVWCRSWCSTWPAATAASPPTRRRSPRRPSALRAAEPSREAA
jgi:trk system potassium uptake protein TrkA